MSAASQFVWFEVMDYMPAVVYATPQYYWSAIRATQFNNATQYRVLIGYWNNSMPTQVNYVLSLNALPNVEVRYFIVPPGPVVVPFTRVNHANWQRPLHWDVQLGRGLLHQHRGCRSVH